MSTTSVLIVEDEQVTRTMLGTAMFTLDLRAHALRFSAEEAMSAAVSEPDVAILDLDLGLGPSGID